MGIIEIWAPEALVVLFLALSLCRPFVKTLWPLDGLIWLPLLSLIIMAAIFPAYGFRPECIPMLVYTVIFNIIRLSSPNDSFRDRGPFLSVCTLLLLAAFAFPMFVFSPKGYVLPENVAEAETARMVKVRKPGTKDYFVRIYGDAEPSRPIIFMVPPEIGSAVSIDLVCLELQARGYTVITYFHKGYDTPVINENGRKSLMSPVKLAAYWRILSKADTSASVNERGKALEAERRADITFLLSQLPVLLNYSRHTSLPPMLLAGYGAGGSALAYLAGEKGFVSSYANVVGVAAIESRLWSSYLPEERPAAPLPAGRKSMYYQWANTTSRLSTLLPKQVSQSGPLPEPEIPLLYVVSGKALYFQERQKSYRAIYNSLRSSTGAIAFAAIKEAGPLDYQDIPVTHPVCSFLLPGQQDTGQVSENPIGDTAAIIGNFASLLLKQDEAAPLPIVEEASAGQESWDQGYAEQEPSDQTSVNEVEVADDQMSAPQAITGSLYIESRNFPGFHL